MALCHRLLKKKMQAYVNEFKEKKEIKKKATNEFYKRERERERERDGDLHKNQNY